MLQITKPMGVLPAEGCYTPGKNLTLGLGEAVVPGKQAAETCFLEQCVLQAQWLLYSTVSPKFRLKTLFLSFLEAMLSTVQVFLFSNKRLAVQLLEHQCGFRPYCPHPGNLQYNTPFADKTLAAGWAHAKQFYFKCSWMLRDHDRAQWKLHWEHTGWRSGVNCALSQMLTVSCGQQFRLWLNQIYCCMSQHWQAVFASVTVPALISMRGNEWGGASKLTRLTLVDSGVCWLNRRAYALRAIRACSPMRLPGHQLVTLLTRRVLRRNPMPYKYLIHTRYHS